MGAGKWSKILKLGGQLGSPAHWKAFGVSAVVHTAELIIQSPIVALHAMQSIVKILYSLVTPVDNSRLGRVFIYLFFHTISQKSMQLGSPNLTLKCSTISPTNSFISGSKGQRSRTQGHEAQKHCWHGLLHFCECWFLVILVCWKFDCNYRAVCRL